MRVYKSGLMEKKSSRLARDRRETQILELPDTEKGKSDKKTHCSLKRSKNALLDYLIPYILGTLTHSVKIIPTKVMSERQRSVQENQNLSLITPNSGGLILKLLYLCYITMPILTCSSY